MDLLGFVGLGGGKSITGKVQGFGKQLYEAKLRGIHSPVLIRCLPIDTQQNQKIKILLQSMTAQEAKSRPLAEQVTSKLTGQVMCPCKFFE